MKMQKKALTVHKNVTHLGQRDFMCSVKNCHKSYGYKHLLQRHMAKTHRSFDNEMSTEYADESLPVSDEEGSASVALDIGQITGYTYSQIAQAKISERKALRCPFPDFSGFMSTNNPTETLQIEFPDTSARETSCDYTFRRAYDLRRHLQAAHRISVQKEIVELWVAEQKLAWYT